MGASGPCGAGMGWPTALLPQADDGCPEGSLPVTQLPSLRPFLLQSPCHPFTNSFPFLSLDKLHVQPILTMTSKETSSHFLLALLKG